MKKVAIVGVEGSGKTVLMAAMGEKYRKPGEDGLFLYANSRKTIEYCNAQIDILRNKRWWPDSTSPDELVNLEWTLMRRLKGRSPEEVCAVSFLDFAGEIYRYAFGDASDDSLRRSQYRNQIEAVKSHLKNADSVMVLVNLRDIINSLGVSPKATEMDWLSQRIFDFAFSDTSARRVAIVFTQKDLYEETIADCGGLEGVFERCLPSVFYRHESQIVPFAVSAVNKTVPDESGNLRPASDFASEGFEALVSWMADLGVTTKADKVRKAAVDKTSEFLQAWEDERYNDAAKLFPEVELNDDAMYAMATMCEHGWGVEQNTHEALKWYQKVVAGGGDCALKASEAIARISKPKIAVSSGNESEDATERFLDLYRKLPEEAVLLMDKVDKSDPRVLGALGYLYYCGEGVARDRAKAFWWRKSAADICKDAEYQIAIAKAYRDGEGTEKNLDESVKYCHRALDDKENDSYKYSAAEILASIYREKRKWGRAAYWWVRSILYDWHFFWTYLVDWGYIARIAIRCTLYALCAVVGIWGISYKTNANFKKWIDGLFGPRLRIVHPSSAVKEMPAKAEKRAENSMSVTYDAALAKFGIDIDARFPQDKVVNVPADADLGKFIDGCPDGSTLKLSEGTYMISTNKDICKSLRIIGVSPERTVVSGGLLGSTCPTVALVVENLSFREVNYKYGVRGPKNGALIVRNCRFDGCGVCINDGSMGVVSGVSVDGAEWTIDVSEGARAVVLDSRLMNVTEYFVIGFENSRIYCENVRMDGGNDNGIYARYEGSQWFLRHCSIKNIKPPQYAFDGVGINIGAQVKVWLDNVAFESLTDAAVDNYGVCEHHNVKTIRCAKELVGRGRYVRRDSPIQLPEDFFDKPVERPGEAVKE